MIRRSGIVLGFAAAYFSPLVIGAVSDDAAGIYSLIGIALSALMIRLWGSRRAAGPYLLIASCCLTVTLADLALRPVILRLPRFSHYALSPREVPFAPSFARFDPGMSVEIETIGDLARMHDFRLGIPRRIKLESDGLGFPNPPGLLENELDVIVLGDSFAAGSGVSQESSVVGLFRKKYGLRAYYVGSVGHGNLWTESIDLEAALPKLKLKRGTTLVWMIFAGNDLDPPYEDLIPDPEEGWERPNSTWIRFRERSPLRILLRDLRVAGLRARYGSEIEVRLFLGGRKILFMKGYISRDLDDPEALKRYFAVDKATAVFDRLGRIATRYGMRVVVVSIPTKERVYAWAFLGQPPWTPYPWAPAFPKIMRELAQQQSFEFLDLGPHFIENARSLYERTGGTLYWLDDSHWSPEGHALAADLIYQASLRPGKR